MSTACRLSNLKNCVTLLFLLMGMLCACGGGGNDDTNLDDGNRHPNNWQRIPVAQLEENGSTLPYVTARQAADGNVHIAYYTAVIESEETQYHRLDHLVWNPGSGSLVHNAVENKPAPSGVNGFDQCDQFDFALDASDTPIFIYPTYEVHPELAQREADIMINLNEGGQWNETTGAIGYVQRNGVYQDGQISENMSMAIDSRGNIHFCYQYFTEGMDSANFRYPDLYYVMRERGTIYDAITTNAGYAQIEELVDGNAFSTYAVHNSVGYFCKLILDEDDRPYIFYAEHGENFMGTFALKMAFKNSSGQWQRQVIEPLDDGWTIGGISPAFFPPDPENPEAGRVMAVAYSLRSPSPEPDDAHRLMFATNRGGIWTTEIVDETTWCGTYCSLAIDVDGTPAIAYYDEQSHSGRTHQFLKYAEFKGLRWMRESVDEYGNVGRYNTLWFDSNNVPNICTFSDEYNEILIIRQINRFVGDE
jgi:hypothetical protein